MTGLEFLIALQDVLTVLMVGHVCWALRRVFGVGTTPLPILLMPLFALVWGAVWAYVPVLSAMRLAPPPLGQAGVILAAVVVLSLYWLTPFVGRRAVSRDLDPLLGMAVWRAIFGLSILAVGMGGGLPPGFYWSVGLGDLMVGLFGIALILRQEPVSRRLFVIWNLLGLADLCHVLILGAVTLVPFFTAHPDAPFVNLLPLAGVPILLSLHVLGLRLSGRIPPRAVAI